MCGWIIGMKKLKSGLLARKSSMTEFLVYIVYFGFTSQEQEIVG
jgi:hypothetical protein